MTRLNRLTLADLESWPFELGAPDPSRIVRGEPKHRTWMLDESPDGATVSGVWESTPGAWRVAYDEWEFCTILNGCSLVTPEDGAQIVLQTGDCFVIHPGFIGVWDVVETTRKSFVVRLPKSFVH